MHCIHVQLLLFTRIASSTASDQKTKALNGMASAAYTASASGAALSAKISIVTLE